MQGVGWSHRVKSQGAGWSHRVRGEVAFTFNCNLINPLGASWWRELISVRV